MFRSKTGQRGFTLTELMSVIVIIGLVMTAVVAIIGPLLRSQGQAQSKVDTVQMAASALYRLERDLRETNSFNIWECTTSGPTCSRLTSFGSTNAVVMPTAYLNGNGQFQVVASTGKPNWQGVEVYWLDSAGNLNVAFDANSGLAQGSPQVDNPTAQKAITDVTTTGGMQIAHNVQQFLVAVPFQHQVSLQLQAQSTVNGSLNETTFNTDTLARN